MPSEIDQYRLLSMMSNRPIVFNGDMCFWFQMFMHKQIAFTIAADMFANVMPSNAMKDELWELQFEAVQKATRLGCKFGFDLADYSGDGTLYNYLSREINKKALEVDGVCPDWKQDPSLMFWFFVENQ